MFKVKTLYDIPENIELPSNMPPSPTSQLSVEDDATAGSSATTSTADPPLTNGSLSVKKVAFCDNISTIKPETPTKEIDESMTQADVTVVTNGSPGGGGGGLENGTGIKKKSSFKVATRNFFIKHFSFLNFTCLRRKNKSKNKTITSDVSADDQIDLKQKSIVVQQSPREKQPKTVEEPELGIVLHEPVPMDQEVLEDIKARQLTILREKRKRNKTIIFAPEVDLKQESRVVQQPPAEKQFKKDVEMKIVSVEVHPVIQMEQEELEDLETRKLTIISELTALKDNMTDLPEKELTQNESGVNATDPGESPPIDYIDVVVNADPRRPPYSLLLFHKILKDFYVGGVRITTHVHSSLTTPLPDHLQVFNIDEDETLDAKKALTIRLIWKNTADLQTELIVKPIHQIPIAGEGNLARYFSRILPMTFPLNSYDPSYDTLDWILLCKVDKLLEDSREKDVNFEGIEEHLRATDGPFLLGQIMTIADFVFFSSAANALIHDYERVVEFPLTQQWLRNCQIYGQFQLFDISI